MNWNFLVTSYNLNAGITTFGIEIYKYMLKYTIKCIHYIILIHAIIFAYLYAYHVSLTKILILHTFHVNFRVDVFEFEKRVKHLESNYFIEF